MTTFGAEVCGYKANKHTLRQPSSLETGQSVARGAERLLIMTVYSGLCMQAFLVWGRAAFHS
ncbi:hypothetical protein BDV11DRAFT_178984 [Aspergillus similis]